RSPSTMALLATRRYTTGAIIITWCAPNVAARWSSSRPRSSAWSRRLAAPTTTAPLATHFRFTVSAKLARRRASALESTPHSMSINFTGRWEADLRQSKLLGPTPKAMTMDITHAGPEMRQEIVVMKDDGSEQRTTFRCQTNGEPDQCRLNDKKIRGTANWQG